jgi:hypothetical protein
MSELDILMNNHHHYKLYYKAEDFCFLAGKKPISNNITLKQSNIIFFNL